MRIRNQKLAVLLTAGMLGISMLSGCGATKQASEEKAAGNVSETDESAEIDESELNDMLAGTFRPSDMVMERQETYEYPFMGLKAVLPEDLMKRMDKKEVAMLPTEDVDDDVAIKYAFLTWNTMTEEQRDAEVEKLGSGYTDWEESLGRIGTLGMIRSDITDQLDKLTGCTEHKKLGKSSDGKYEYYLSTNPDADQTLTDEVKKIKATITDMTPFDKTSAFSQPVERNTSGNVGKFETKDIDGTAYTEKVFADYDLTLVNLFATWCSPCVQELPELEKLREEMKEKGVNVVGVVMDTADENGEQDETAIEKAKVLKERAGVTYPFLIPDSTRMSGRLNGIEAYPESFFVDKNGNIVSEAYVGSNNLEGWKEIVETELAKLKGEK